jgi:iron complex transport system ATP-binding protein
MTTPVIAVDAGIVLQASSVDLVRDGRLLLDQVSLTVRAGELWALLGPNGAGKSTLLRLLATLAHPTRGHVDILGQRLGRVDVFTLRPMIAHVSGHHRVDGARTVREVVLTGATGTIEFVPRWQPSGAELARAEAAIDLLGLEALAGSRWLTLSQGERGRTLIARALLTQARVLLLDEPAAGLDVAGREQLLVSLDELRRQRPDLAAILVTHHVEELPASTSHAILLRAGRSVAAGSADAVLASELISACFDYPLTIAREPGGRWTSRAAGGPKLAAAVLATL